jgi:hypothetical protein
MNEPLKKFKAGDSTIWITQPQEFEELVKRRETAFQVAIGKYADSHGKIETVMQTAEAFGRGLFEEYIKLDSNEWTIDSWVKPVVEKIFNPLGTGATFTKITQDEAKSIIFRCRLHENAGDSPLASLFTYGFLRGMLRSAFPDGEILMEKSISQGAPVIELTFKATAAEEDRWERERVKNTFTHLTKRSNE